MRQFSKDLHKNDPRPPSDKNFDNQQSNSSKSVISKEKIKIDK